MLLTVAVLLHSTVDRSGTATYVVQLTVAVLLRSAVDRSGIVT